MRKIFFIVLSTISVIAYGQDKYNYVHFNELTEVVGTEYVIASIENKGKMFKTENDYLLFIHTKTGETNEVNFSNDAIIEKFEQIKVDSLDLNVIVVSAKTVDLNRKNGIDWNDPKQIIIISSDGKTKTQLTENRFFVRDWTVNKSTGTILIAGHYDTNNNNKYDKTDKNEIHIYDLKTLKLINKI